MWWFWNSFPSEPISDEKNIVLYKWSLVKCSGLDYIQHVVLYYLPLATSAINPNVKVLKSVVSR